MITKAAGIRIAKHLDRAVPHAWLIQQLPFVANEFRRTGDGANSITTPKVSASTLGGCIASSAEFINTQEQPIETIEPTASNQ